MNFGVNRGNVAATLQAPMTELGLMTNGGYKVTHIFSNDAETGATFMHDLQAAAGHSVASLSKGGGIVPTADADAIPQ